MQCSNEATRPVNDSWQTILCKKTQIALDTKELEDGHQNWQHWQCLLKQKISYFKDNNTIL